MNAETHQAIKQLRASNNPKDRQLALDMAGPSVMKRQAALVEYRRRPT